MHWTIQLNGGPQRVNHAAASVDKYIYSFGGCCDLTKITESEPEIIDVHVLDTDNLRWKTLVYTADNRRAIPFQRYGHTVVAHGHKIYLWGGRHFHFSSDVLHCFDTSRNHWSLPDVSGSFPPDKDGHSACVMNDYMYIFGGCLEDGELNEHLFRIHLGTFIWETVITTGIAPFGRDFHTASSIGNRMYIFGGRSFVDSIDMDTESDHCYDYRMAYLDTTTMEWSWPITLGNGPLGRRSHSAVVWGENILILCGYNSVVNEHFNDVHIYNTGTDTWNCVDVSGMKPSERRRQCCCLVNGRVFLFGGTRIKRINQEDHLTDVFVPPKYIDFSDLYIMDLSPTLYRLCLYTVIKTLRHSLAASGSEKLTVLPKSLSMLPVSIQFDIKCMTTDNEVILES